MRFCKALCRLCVYVCLFISLNWLSTETRIKRYSRYGIHSGVVIFRVDLLAKKKVRFIQRRKFCTHFMEAGFELCIGRATKNIFYEGFVPTLWLIKTFIYNFLFLLLVANLWKWLVTSFIYTILKRISCQLKHNLFFPWPRKKRCNT